MDMPQRRIAATDHRRARGLGALLLTALCLTGCLDLPKQSTPITFWVLGPVAEMATGAEQARSMLVGPVSLPDYLNRAEVMHRAGDHQLTVEHFDHWGDSLAEQIPRVLSEDLMRLAPGMIAASFPTYGVSNADYQLVVNVLAFEVDADGDVQLLADWKLNVVGSANVLAHRVARLHEPAGDRSVAEIVAAMSRALGALARDVAGALPPAAGGATSP